MSDKHLKIRKEYIDNEETDVELEEETDGDTRVPYERKLYDPEKVRVDTHQFSLRNILDMIGDREIDLAPDFRRYQAWTQKQKSRLIESVLLRIPLPAFYFSSDSRGVIQVVDGVRRLTTLFDFVRAEPGFCLSDLKYLNEQVGGKSVRTLGREWIARINKTQITANIIDPHTPHKVKFDIFKRLNTGGTPLVAQEIRHCLSSDRSRSFLRETATSEEFLKVMPAGIVSHKRMANIEMVLRAAAYKLHLPEILGSRNLMKKSYRQYESPDMFLNAVTEYIDNEISDNDLTLLKSSLCTGLNNAYELFGENAFRKWPMGDKRLYPINKALFDVWTVLLSQYSWEDIKPGRKEIIGKFRSACSDSSSDFYASISRSTAKPKSVATRFRTVDKILKSED